MLCTSVGTILVIDPDHLEENEVVNSLVNSKCAKCRATVVRSLSTACWEVDDRDINKRCGHSTHCSALDNCARCHTFFIQCQHCKPALCQWCERDAAAKLEDPSTRPKDDLD